MNLSLNLASSSSIALSFSAMRSGPVATCQVSPTRENFPDFRRACATSYRRQQKSISVTPSFSVGGSFIPGLKSLSLTLSGSFVSNFASQAGKPAPASFDAWPSRKTTCHHSLRLISVSKGETTLWPSRWIPSLCEIRTAVPVRTQKE